MALRSTSLSSPIVPNCVRSSSGCGTDDCGRTSGPSRPSTMPSPPSTRPRGARGRRSFVFVREDGETATDSALLVGHHHRLDRRDQFATMVGHPTLLTPGPLSDCFSLKRRAACHPERSARNARVAKDLLLRRVAKNLLVLGPYERQVVPWPVDFGTAHSTHMQPAEDSMSKLRVHNFAISLDGYGAGPRQGLKDPLGVGGEELHGWYVGTRGFREINGKTGGRRVPTTILPSASGKASGRISWAETCSAPCAGRGPTTSGAAGGARTRRITCRCSC